MKPKDASDVQFAARMIMEGLCSQELMQQVLKAQQDLMDRGKPLTIAQICVKKKWLTRPEARFYIADDTPPTDLVSGFEIEKELGAGGMSRVFLARAGSDAPIALKVLRPALARDEVQRARFVREGELLAELSHENIVAGHGVTEVEGLFVYAMEYVPGTELLELIDRGEVFHEDAALYVILQTARALTHMKDSGLVHRDIKPGNILITPDNTVKLCDLGLAARAGDDDEAGETTVGTVAYLSPEQARGDATDIRSDIYSLGITLYQLVIGEIPFEGDDDHETMAKRFFETLKSSKLAKASPHMHYFIQKMMAQDPAHRYQTPEDLIADVEDQIRGKKTLTVNPLTNAASDLELEKPFSAPTSKKKIVRKSDRLGRRRRR